jgi:hypothetical protein
MSPGDRIGAAIDRGLAKAKGFGPYAISLSSGMIGISMYKLGDPNTWLALTLQVLGVLMCLFCVASIFLWHFLQWPKWFGKAPGRR